MIIIAGYTLTEASKRDAAVDAHAPMVGRARAFDGCLDLSISADALDPERINIFELGRELIELGAGELTHAGVTPHRLYAEGMPPKRNGPDMVDRMMELLDPALSRRIAEKAAARGE